MKIKLISTCSTEATMNDGTRILYSFSSPVAIIKPTGEFYRSGISFSRTTSIITNQWLIGNGCPQSGSTPKLPHFPLELAQKIEELYPFCFHVSKNQVEFTFNNGDKILFSYETPVVCYDATQDKQYATATKHSRTTTRHINEYIQQSDKPGLVISQVFLDGFAAKK